MDHGDFHDGSTDMFVRATSGDSFYFTALAKDGNVELFRSRVSTRRRRRLTQSPPGARLSHPQLSPCGEWITLTGLIDGQRNIFVVSSEGGKLEQVTHYPPGMGAIHPTFRPKRPKSRMIMG